MMNNVARLTDLALSRYQAVDAILRRAARGDGVMIHLACANDLETCVFSVERANRFARHLGSMGVLNVALLPADADALAVTEIRGAVEHSEERIIGAPQVQRGRRPPPYRPPIVSGQPNWLAANEAFAAIGEQRLLWTVLARNIEALYIAVTNPID